MNQSLSPTKTFVVAIAALGVVFGDIGTSVLYALQECFHGHHPFDVTPENIIGIVSLIVWSLIFVVSFKYVFIMMKAENKGEGGILTLLSLVPNQFKVGRKSSIGVATVMAVIGASLLFGDGIITPAISVLSAMEGLEIANPAFSPYIVPGTIAILLWLFSIQKSGTGKIGKYFGIIVLTWFIVIGFMGIRHISDDWNILKAFNPLEGLDFLIRHGWRGPTVLGSVILAVTGGEALYADMGHFGRKPIRLAWHAIVLPALLLNYLGQGAMLLKYPELSHKPFYSMIDQGIFYYGLVILATLATIIASQALITGAFSLIHQAIRLGLFPRLDTIHTSEELEGRVYIPFMNWLLAVCCILLVFLFKRSSALTAAYGLAVAGTMALTTLVYFYVCRYRWKWSLLKALPLVSVLLFVDLAFLGANIPKIPDGGYIPLLIGAFFFIIILIWRHGRTQLSNYYQTRSKSLDLFFKELECKQTRRIPGTLVVLSSNEDIIPPVVAKIADSLHVIHEHLLMVTVVTEDVPYVKSKDQVYVKDIKHGVSRVIMHFGFMEYPDVPLALSKCSFEHMDHVNTDEVLYMLGRETFVINAKTTLGKLRQNVFAFLSRNSTSASDYFNLPAHQIFEVGSQLSI